MLKVKFIQCKYEVLESRINEFLLKIQEDSRYNVEIVDIKFNSLIHPQYRDDNREVLIIYKLTEVNDELPEIVQKVTNAIV